MINRKEPCTKQQYLTNQRLKHKQHGKDQWWLIYLSISETYAVKIQRSIVRLLEILRSVPSLLATGAQATTGNVQLMES